MPDIYTPAQVAECKARAERKVERCLSLDGCPGCEKCGWSNDNCVEYRTLALCATVEALWEVVWELGERASTWVDTRGDYGYVPKSLILRARELGR